LRHSSPAHCTLPCCGQFVTPFTHVSAFCALHYHTFLALHLPTTTLRGLSTHTPSTHLPTTPIFKQRFSVYFHRTACFIQAWRRQNSGKRVGCCVHWRCKRQNRQAFGRCCGNACCRLPRHLHPARLARAARLSLLPTSLPPFHLYAFAPSPSQRFSHAYALPFTLTAHIPAYHMRCMPLAACLKRPKHTNATHFYFHPLHLHT